MHISMVKAALGGELEVPVLDGTVKYSIPEGTQPGTVFRLRGKGVPSLRSGARGDQYVTVKVQIPKGLNSEQKDLLRQFDEAMGNKSEKKSKLFEKSKKKNVVELNRLSDMLLPRVYTNVEKTEILRGIQEASKYRISENWSFGSSVRLGNCCVCWSSW